MRSSLYKFLTKEAGQATPAPVPRNTVNTLNTAARGTVDSTRKNRNLTRTSTNNSNAIVDRSGRARNLVNTFPSGDITDRAGISRRLVTNFDNSQNTSLDNAHLEYYDTVTDAFGRNRRLTDRLVYSNHISDEEAARLVAQVEQELAKIPQPSVPQTLTVAPKATQPAADPSAASQWESIRSGLASKPQHEQRQERSLLANDPTVPDAVKAHIADYVQGSSGNAQSSVPQTQIDPAETSQWESIRTGLEGKPQHEQLQELSLLANDPHTSDAIKTQIAKYVQGSSGNAQPSLPTEERANVSGNLNRLSEAASALRAVQQQQLRDNTTTLGSDIAGGSTPSVAGPGAFDNSKPNTNLSSTQTTTKPVNKALAINQTHALNVDDAPANLTMRHTSFDAPSALEGIRFDNYTPEMPAPIKSNVPEKVEVPEQQAISEAQQPAAQSNNIVFRNGHAVKFDPSKVDWTTPDGPTPNNVGGTWYTDDQYAAFDNIRGQLYSSYTSQGMNSQKARDLATRRAKQYIGDQMQMARGGTAFNKWKDQPAPEVAPAPAVTTAPAAAQAPAVADIPGQPNYATMSIEDPISASGQPTDKLTIADSGSIGRGMTITPIGSPLLSTPTKKPKVVNSSPHKGKIAPLSTIPKKAPKSVANKNKFADKTWTQQEILGELKNRRNSVAKGLIPVKGREGLYYKDGDASQTIVDRLGRPMTYKGQVINDALLRNDTGWGWLLGMDSYGNEILHNAEQYAQREASRNFNDELAALGFKPVPGNKRWYVNDKGQYVDISGELAPSGTIASQLDTNRTMGQRWQKDNYDPWGWFISGDMDDIGIQR